MWVNPSGSYEVFFGILFYFHSVHKFSQAAKKSQKFYHGNEAISQLDETEKLNEVEESGQKRDHVVGNNDNRLSFSDFSKYVKTVDFSKCLMREDFFMIFISDEISKA